MIHGGVRGEFQPQPVLDGRHQEHRFGRIQPEAGELRVSVDRPIGQLERGAQIIGTPRLDVWLGHVRHAYSRYGFFSPCRDVTAISGAPSALAAPVSPARSSAMIRVSM